MSWTTSSASTARLADATPGSSRTSAPRRAWVRTAVVPSRAARIRETRGPVASSRARAVPALHAHRARFASARHATDSFPGPRGGRDTACCAYAAPPPSAGDDSRPEDWAELLKKLRKAKWDAAPKPWKEFWATRVAAAVVEVDVDNESVSAKEVEGIGLNAPKDKAEALERFKHNVVVYRQNYALVAWGACTFFAALSNDILCAVGLVCAAAAAAAASDTLLGELQLATDNKLTWNKTRVAGLDRAGVSLATRIGAAVSFALAAYVSGFFEFFLAFANRLVFYGLAPCAAHAVLRPIDLKSTLSDLWNDAKGVQTKEEAAALAKKGVKGIKNWWNNRRPAEPTPVVMSVKGDPDAAYRQAGFAGERARQDAEESARRAREAQDDEGVVDTEGWAKPDAKGELPPGKSR